MLLQCLQGCLSRIYLLTLPLTPRQHFYPIPNCIFREMPPAWLTCSTMSCSGPVGTGCNWRGLVPGLFSNRLFLWLSCCQLFDIWIQYSKKFEVLWMRKTHKGKLRGMKENVKTNKNNINKTETHAITHRAAQAHSCYWQNYFKAVAACVVSEVAAYSSVSQCHTAGQKYIPYQQHWG